MVVDGRTLAEGDELVADVCVVGAGPAGITTALELARAGIKVCLLESGDREPVPEAQKLNEGKSVGYWYYPLATTRARAFGGTSARWFDAPADQIEGWRTRPLDPVDFEARAAVAGSGWPFDVSELQPFYSRAQELCRLGPYDYECKSWEAADAQALDLGERMTTAIFHHGWDGFASYLGQVKCADAITCVLNSTVLEIATDESASNVRRVLVGRPLGTSFTVRARFYVLAAGGIENPRLLLLSRRARPSGLGNGEDLVGRFFMERLTGRTGFIVPTPRLLDRIGLYELRRIGAAAVQGVLTPSNDVVRDEGLLNCAFFLVPSSRAASSRAVRSAATLFRAVRRRPLPKQMTTNARTVLVGLPEIAGFGYRRLRGTTRNDVLAVRVQAEQAPNADSRVTLDPHKRDPFGLPQPRLDWRVTELDHWSVSRAQDLLDEGLRRAGLGRVEAKLRDEQPHGLFLGSFHHMGTTRMHERPRLGVIDADCQVHGVANLFVTGSSVFPTTGYANPTLTIVALALRLAEHMKRRLEAGPS